MSAQLTRKEVRVGHTWDLTDLFPTVEAWEAGLAAVEASLPTVTRFKGHLGEGAPALLGCLEAAEKLQEQLIRVGTYAGLSYSGDGTDPVNQGMVSKVGSLEAQAQAAMAFIRSEVLALPEGTVERYLAAEPGLGIFRGHLEEMLKYKPHMLNPETEEAIASLGEVHDAPYMIYERTKSADMRFQSARNQAGDEVALTFALYEESLETSTDVTLRRNSFKAFTKGLQAYQNTLAATFATEIKKNVVLARLRKYETTAHMLLQPHNTPLHVYHNILDVIQSELAPHMRRYAALRKRVLGLDHLLYCDIEAPLDPEFKPEITYEGACELIMDALKVMGPEYNEIMRDSLTRRWVDRAENEGKTTGAFCATPYGVHPYILMTWADNMRGTFTLAHELGHAGHFALANKYQRLTNTDVSMFFVEAPSTLNEILLGQHILAKTSDLRMRRWVIMQFLATYHHNFVRHLLEAELQRRIYDLAEAGNPITATTLSETKGAILERFWGGEVTIDDGARLTWMRQPHYYMGLYPYTYSAGLSASTAVAQLIREEGQPAVDRWLQVLKAGSTLKPMELMALAGVDMSQPEPLRKAVAYVGQLVTELENSF